MNSLPNHHFQNKSFYQLSFDGGHLTQYGGHIFLHFAKSLFDYSL
ncbi:IS1380-Spn1 transposase [Streptococcus pneumoniae]|nr:IS1380-Spn1 transposase [Streptococcus pneumoniae]